MDKLRTISLFSGACGLDVGVERSGIVDIVACVEISPIFCETIRANRDRGLLGSRDLAVLQADLANLTSSELLGMAAVEAGEIDLVIGGPPCQSFSTAGRRRTVLDPRGELLWDFIRFIAEVRPRFFIMENVRGLLSAALRHRAIAERPGKGGPPLEPDELPGSVMSLWIEDLRAATEDQYRVDCFEVNSVNYGAPQIRERALLIGNREGLKLDFPQPTHGPVQGLQPPLFEDASMHPWATLRDAIGSLTEDAPELLDFSPRKKRYLSLVSPGGNWRTLPESIQQESMGRAWHAKGGRSGWWRRLSWDLPSPTVVTMPNHASTSMCHPDEIRVLSLAECAAIQEFPEEWVFCGTTAQKYEQVGNAVPPRLGEIAARVVGDAARMLADESRTDEVEHNRAAAASEPHMRRDYVNSHVRTRKWYKAGETLVWNDGGANENVEY